MNPIREAEEWIAYVGPNQVELHRLFQGIIGEEADLTSKLSLVRISKMSARELQEYGFSEQTAKRLVCVFELARRIEDYSSFQANHEKIMTSEQAYQLGKWLAHKDREHFVAVYLNAANLPIYRKIISIGTLNTSVIHPREVFKYAVKESAASVILFHNHPSGSLVESVEDVNLTLRLVEVGKQIGIPIFDHLIISEKGYTSLKDKGYL